MDLLIAAVGSVGPTLIAHVQRPGWNVDTIDLAGCQETGVDWPTWALGIAATYDRLLLVEVASRAITGAQFELWRAFESVFKPSFALRPDRVYPLINARPRLKGVWIQRYATVQIDDMPTAPLDVATAPLISVGQARAYLVHKAKRGARCPCCTRLVKIYPRTINENMVKILMVVRHYFSTVAPGASWLQVPRYIEKLIKLQHLRLDYVDRDWQKFVHWGLIERLDAQRADGSNRNGYYRILEPGIDFLEGRIAVPRFIYEFNGAAIGFSEEALTVEEAYGERFNFMGMMNWGASPDFTTPDLAIR